MSDDSEVTSPDVSGLDGRRVAAEFDLADDGSSYTCTRSFGAPPERVFRAFTDPDDLRVWFPSGAPPGSEMPVCESDPVEGGRYHYVMVVAGFGQMSWHGTYTAVDRPGRLDAEEWFVTGDGEPSGPPAVQSLTFDAVGDGLTFMTMRVEPPEPEDRETFTEQSAAGLAASLAALDDLVSD